MWAVRSIWLRPLLLGPPMVPLQAGRPPLEKLTEALPGSSTDSGTTTTGTPSTQYPTVTAAGTTATGDGFIAVSTTFDTGIASAFGLSETEFSSRVRLLMEPTYYQALVGSTTEYYAGIVRVSLH